MAKQEEQQIEEQKIGEEKEVKGNSDVKDWDLIESDVFKFENENDSLEGVLRKIEPSSEHPETNVYTIEQDDGKLKIVFGTMILDSRMSMIPIGSEVKIVFKGTKEATKKGHNDTKLFDVYRR